MVEINCDDHDRYITESQFIKHTVGRVFYMLMLESSPIDTKDYEYLLNLVENTCGDIYDLQYGLFMFNKNLSDMLERLDLDFEDLDFVKQVKHSIERASLVEDKQEFMLDFFALRISYFQIQFNIYNFTFFVVDSKQKRHNFVLVLKCFLYMLI